MNVVICTYCNALTELVDSAVINGQSYGEKEDIGLADLFGEL